MFCGNCSFSTNIAFGCLEAGSADALHTSRTYSTAQSGFIDSPASAFFSKLGFQNTISRTRML